LTAGRRRPRRNLGASQPSGDRGPTSLDGEGPADAPGKRELSLAQSIDERDPEADAVPGLTRDRNSRSEGRRSMCSAIHITSRTWLRPSSTREPSDPPLRVVPLFARSGVLGIELLHHRLGHTNINKERRRATVGRPAVHRARCRSHRRTRLPLQFSRLRVSPGHPDERDARLTPPSRAARGRELRRHRSAARSIGNDPSAGSPTETLLRLLLPLNDQV
jgi:hypothetical protein